MARKRASAAGSRKANGSAHGLALAEVATRIDSALAAIGALPEDVLQEATSAAELSLAIEDAGWVRLGGLETGGISEELRRKTVARSRAYWHLDPVARHVVRLWTVYSVGTGLSYKAREPGQQAELDAFFQDPRNRRVLSPLGQQKSSRKLLTDGELPFALFPFKDGLVVRRIDPLQITRVLTDPEDSERVLFYKREVQTANGRKRTTYLRDWLEAEEDDLPAVIDPDTRKIVNEEAEDEPLVYFVSFEDMDARGNGLLQPALDWLRELRKFLETRVAFSQALMRYAWKLRAKGGKTAVDDLRAKLASSLTSNFTQGEKNPAAAPGSTFIENMAAELVGLPRESGAAGARSDADLYKLQIASGTGIFLHYLGDPSTGNLATATAMELPMLKQFESYQQLWTSVYADFCQIALALKRKASREKPAFVDIDWPPIVQRDLPQVAEATSQLFTALPGLQQPEVLQIILLALGVNNVDEVVKRVLAAAPRETAPADAEKLAQALKETKETFERVLAEAAGAGH